MVEVKVNKTTDNPFYGLRNCLSLYQNANKGIISEHLLNQCWLEVAGDKQKREMFFALLFSIGDITARQHNIFRKNKVDSGGGANRMSFSAIMSWMKENHYDQFKKFMFAHLFNEYVSFDALLSNRVITKKKTKNVIGSFDSLNGSKEYINDLADFVASVIKGNNPADKYFLAKFLTRPRLSKRKRHKIMLPQTKRIMRQREFFLKLVSIKANLRYLSKHSHIEFHGYYEWRKQYIGELESVLFSSKRILEFDKQQFLAWLEKLPASARYRVRCRLLDKDSKVKESIWTNLGSWFLEWEKYKDTKQTEVRELEETLRQDNTRSTAERTEVEVKLATARKQAKVTTGAVNFSDMFRQIVTGNVDKTMIQPFLDKVNLPYNTLVFIDDSSSMTSNSCEAGFTAFDFAAFMATICLMKNPEDSGRSLIGFYSITCRMFTTMTSQSQFVNRIMTPIPSTIVGGEPLIKPEAHFLENLQRMRSFSNSIRTGSMTNISAIPEYLNKWVGGDLSILEQLQAFPVWTIITDGNWNNLNSPEASINDFMMKCQRYFGYKPFVIAIDVSYRSSAAIERFQGIENFMYVPPNPAQIEQLLVNFRDMDIMDVYTPLQSFYRSNRYDLVKANVL